VKLPAKLQGKSWETTDGAVLSEHLEQMLIAIRGGMARALAIPGALGNSDRRVDRATQILRKAGLIEFAGGKWRIVVERVAGDL
jgi:hypothetical protein